MKKVLFGVLAFVLLTASAALAQGYEDEKGSATGDAWWLVSGDLSCYYGEGVLDEADGRYTAEWQVKNGSVKQKMVIEGTTYIYAADDDELLDVRPIKITIWFLDQGGDAGLYREDNGTFWPSWRSPDLEKLTFTGKIKGVYEERWLNDHGNFSLSWTSGDCSGP